MAIAATFTRKNLTMVIAAIDAQIDAQVARYQEVPPSEDHEGDYGNDLHLLRLQRHALQTQVETDIDTSKIYECWADPADNSLSLLHPHAVEIGRINGQFSENATLLYRFIAQTGEEAMAIHHLRQGWAPYVPMGEAAPCPKCTTPFYPQGYGDCWRCGHIG